MPDLARYMAFFQGAVYLLVGPIWIAKEAKQFLIETGGCRASRKSAVAPM